MSRLRVLAGGFARAALLLAFSAPGWAQQPLGWQEGQRIAVARSQQLASKDAAAAAVREMGVAAGRAARGAA